MTRNSNNKIRALLAVDGSEESLGAVRYVAKSLQRATTEVILYQVISKVPEVFWDLGKDPVWQKKIESVKAWEKQQEKQAGIFLKTVLDIFAKNGFAPDQITSRIGIQKEGIARDIVAEARRGYDLLVIGRGKNCLFTEMPLGSVASKLIYANGAPSLWLIGGKPSSDKVLVSMDFSPNAMRAVEHAGRMFNRGTNTFTLFHAIRGIPINYEGMEEIFPDEYRQQLLDDAEREIRPAMEIAEAKLHQLDIAPERICSKIIAGVGSRAATIMDEARRGGYGTIVMGRRGITEVPDFTMGRVTNKVVQVARDQTLCIVS